MLSNVVFNIPNFINKLEHFDNAYLSVYSAEVPNSFYLINDYNNTLVIFSNFDISTNSYTLTNGNYTITNLLSALSTLLGSNYTLTYNSITYKITITNSLGNFTIVNTSFSYGNTTMQRILGMNTVDTGSFHVGSVYSLTFPFMANLLPQQKIHFRSSILELDNYNTFDKSNDVFLSLGNNAVQGSTIFYKNTSNTCFLLTQIDHLQVIDIRITDDKNRLLDFNNVNWYLTLQIDYESSQKETKFNLIDILGRNNRLIEEYIKHKK
jgi:hypothetical protein